MEAKLLDTFDAGDDFTFRVYEIVTRGKLAYSVQMWSPAGEPVTYNGRGRVVLFPDRASAARSAERQAEAAQEALGEEYNAMYDY